MSEFTVEKVLFSARKAQSRQAKETSGKLVDSQRLKSRSPLFGGRNPALKETLIQGHSFAYQLPPPINILGCASIYLDT